LASAAAAAAAENPSIIQVSDCGTVRFRVAARIERRQRQELRVAFDVARGQIRKGYSLKMALTNLALGADALRPRLAKRGVHVSANTLRADLGQPVGQLVKPAPGQRFGDQRPYKRALTYNLIEMSQRFGHLGQRLLSEFVLWAFERTDSALSSSSSPRARGYLKWAVENAYEGVRSTVGNRLAWACATKFWLPEVETMKIMTAYLGQVDRGSRPYTPREAMATVRSVYRRVIPTMRHQAAYEPMCVSGQ
jgi:hypothetical protein